MIGTVEDVQFTTGGLGNQWTTIDGKKYMTWWNFHTHPVRIGKRVEYSVSLQQQVSSMPAMFADVATIHRILEDGDES